MSDGEAKVTIYALTDPDTGKVRYVGQTIGDPVKRHYEHMVASRGPQRTPVGHWIRRLAEDGKVPGLTILEAQVTPWRSAQRECWWIGHYVGNGMHLLNKTTARVSRWKPSPRSTATCGSMSRMGRDPGCVLKAKVANHERRGGLSREDGHEQRPHRS